MRGPLRVISEMAQPVLWDLLLGVGWLWNLPILRKARRPWTGAVVLALSTQAGVLAESPSSRS